jgi:hypothetical protein
VDHAGCRACRSQLLGLVKGLPLDNVGGYLPVFIEGINTTPDVRLVGLWFRSLSAVCHTGYRVFAGYCRGYTTPDAGNAPQALGLTKGLPTDKGVCAGYFRGYTIPGVGNALQASSIFTSPRNQSPLSKVAGENALTHFNTAKVLICSRYSRVF